MKSAALVEIGDFLRALRKGVGLMQEQVAAMAGISRPRYREIETGSSAARATTLQNIARAISLELVFIPQSMVPAVNAQLQPHGSDEDLPAFVSSSDDDADAWSRFRSKASSRRLRWFGKNGSWMLFR